MRHARDLHMSGSGHEADMVKGACQGQLLTDAVDKVGDVTGFMPLAGQG